MRTRRSQRGASLFFALIVLGLMTMLALSAFNVGNVNLKIVGNVQARQEATNAADVAIQKVLSSSTFSTAPAPYSTSVDVDVNNDTVADYTSTVAANCLTYRPYPAPGQALDPFDRCNTSSSIGPMCTQTYWDMSGHAVPAAGSAYRGNAGTAVTVHQGVSLQMDMDLAQAACP